MIHIVEFTILGLFVFIFVFASCILAYYDTEMSQEKEQTKKYEISRKIRSLTVTAYGCLVIMLFNFIYMFSTVPETVVVKIVESTSAPVTEATRVATETIIPPEEETIHIEDATSEPTVPSEPSSPAVKDEPEHNVDPDDLEMLACVIYQEAGGNGSCDDCRRYVADIVLNRVNDDRFPDTMEEVLTAKNQYGRFHYTGVKWPKRAKYDIEKEAVARAYRIAEEVLSGKHSKLFGEGYIWQAGFKQGKDGFWCCGHFYGR